jgi:MFS family permease
MGIKCILLRLPNRQFPSFFWIRQISAGKVYICIRVRSLSFEDLRGLLGSYLTFLSVLWAIVLACHGGASNFAGIVTLRVLLGVFESAISPGFSLITGLWYKPSEHPSRHAIWFAGNGLAALFGGVLSYSISHINNSVAPWRVSLLS